MFSLPSIEPRDSHTLWFTPSQRSRRSGALHNNHPTNTHANARRNGHFRAPLLPPSSDSLAALMLEERALRIRKQNIASFGYSWIRPAGYPKTMQGIREEEAEREEAANAALEGEMEFTGEAGLDGGGDGVAAGQVENPEALEAMERDLDDEIPDADETGGGLVEDGEDGLDEDDLGEEDEEELMERDLDDDIPEGFELDDDGGGDFDNQVDLDDDIPSAPVNEEDDSMMERDLDAEIAEEGEDDDDSALQQEWEHTDTDADEDEDEDDSENDNYPDGARHDGANRYSFPAAHRVRSGVSALNENSPPLPPPVARHRETEAQRLFLERWSGEVGAEADDSMVAFRSSGTSDRNLRIPRIRTRRRRSMLSVESGDSIG
ncbi:hypothetical protein PRK78_007312 [Emydomyces testavorans]|uniref:Apc15p protein n=1 Tax=Emydomyces testavorans TaxID=2070801 RepID=A0AAF0DN05_9EURO|nr:hypothetical protein PRK78_007312 [Emydomyces testavorans]